MNKLILAVLGLLSSTALASENGGYYTCDAEILAADNQCIFALTGDQPEDWVQEPVLHDLDRTVGDDFYRGVQSYTGDMLSVSPKPWVNGDELVGTTTAVTGDDWSGYALIFELMAPLRDMIMYEPDKLTDDVWAAYTKALTDCNSKTEDYVSRSGGTPFSTAQVREYVLNPGYTDIHHFILQYLEEGTMDLVCLSTDLEMEHCDTIRATAGADAAAGDRCNCWFDAYAALYGACPVVDTVFTTCSNTAAPTACADVVAVDTSGLSGDDGELPSPPDGGEPTGVPTGKGPPSRR